MYEIEGYDEEDQLQKLLGFKLPEEQQQESFQAQEPPQLQQGLLGNTGATPELPHSATELSNQMAQTAQAANQSAGGSDLSANRNSAMQTAQQAQAQQAQQNAQELQMLINLGKMFMGGGV